MSRSYWLSIFAVIGLLGVNDDASADELKNVSDSKQDTTTSEQHLESASKVQSWQPYFIDWLSAKFGVTGCGPYSVDRLGYGKQRQENAYNETCDLEAQESVANSTRWLLFIALLQSLLGIVGTILVWRSLKLNRDAIKAAIDTSTATREGHRAWVDTKITIDAMTAKARIEAKNVGDTPALNVTVSQAGIFFSSKDRAEAEIDNFIAKKLALNRNGTGVALFPNEEVEVELISKEAVQESATKAKTNNIESYIITAATYSILSESIKRHTVKVYKVIGANEISSLEEVFVARRIT
jgi:hypothetical protein